jgi:hypothetical protein
MVNMEVGFDLSDKSLYVSLFSIEGFWLRYLVYRVLRFSVLKLRYFLLKFQDDLGYLLFGIGFGTITGHGYYSGVLR